MKFAKWVKKNNMTMTQVAHATGLSKPTIANLRDRKVDPRATTCRRVIAFTRGEVTLDDLAVN